MHTGMRFPVADQARLLRERFAAYITDVGTFPRVDEQVLPVGCATRESLPADVTVVGSVTGVRHHVLLEPMVLGERFPALLANEALAPLVLQEYVLIEILLCYHTPLAYLALVLRLEVGPLLVDVEGVTVRAGLPADVADYRALFVLETHVESHVTLHLELLTAVLAIVLVLGRVFTLEVFLQSAPILTLELANVAGVLLRLGGVSIASFAPAHPFHGVFPADVRMKRGLVRALVIAEVASVCQTVHVLQLLFLGFVLERHVHLERDQATTDLEADLALVTLSLIVDSVTMTFQHLHHRETDVAVLARVHLVVVVVVEVLVHRDGFVHVLLLYLHLVETFTTARRRFLVARHCARRFVLRVVLHDLVGRFWDRFLVFWEL